MLRSTFPARAVGWALAPDQTARPDEADPYVLNGLVTRWWVREWTTVVGKDAAHPVAMPEAG